MPANRDVLYETLVQEENAVSENSIAAFDLARESIVGVIRGASTKKNGINGVLKMLALENESQNGQDHALPAQACLDMMAALEAASTQPRFRRLFRRISFSSPIRLELDSAIEKGQDSCIRPLFFKELELSLGAAFAAALLLALFVWIFHWNFWLSFTLCLILWMTLYLYIHQVWIPRHGLRRFQKQVQQLPPQARSYFQNRAFRKPVGKDMLRLREMLFSWFWQ